MTARDQGQQEPMISLLVEQHPHARDLPHGGYLVAEVKPDAVEIDRNLQPGDIVTIQVANADGEVIGTATQEIGKVGFAPLKMDKRVVGQVRGHAAKDYVG